MTTTRPTSGLTNTNADVRVLLWHLMLYGAAAIAEETETDVRLGWSAGMKPSPRLTWDGADEQLLGSLVRDHAAARAVSGAWPTCDVTIKGQQRGLFSPRLAAFDEETWPRVQRARHDVIDTLTDHRAWLDMRFLAALGEPAYWSHNFRGEQLPDDGASRFEMQPRNRGSEIVSNRLRPLATAIAQRPPEAVTDGLLGLSVRDEVGKDALDSRTATGLASPGAVDSAVAWCALWGISCLPLAMRVNPSGRRSGTAVVSGHLGRNPNEWFYVPVWNTEWSPARLRSIQTSEQLKTAASAGLTGVWAAADTEVTAAKSWLRARGVVGIVRFPIERFGSDNAPERRAMRGEIIRTE